MYKIGDIVSENIFLNAFKICQNYINDQQYIRDVNLRLLSSALKSLKEKRIKEYYQKYIKTELVYALPEFFSTDTIFIPKDLTSVREYRFFSMFSLILYNAVGLIFVHCCSDLLQELDFKRKNIYSYYPTKFFLDDNIWKARSTYKTEYSEYIDTLNKILQPNDILLKLDISEYFESIQHSRLLNILLKYSKESYLNSFNINKNNIKALKFYFESLMSRQSSIPQGRKNFVSDFLGYLYLVPFDIKISNLINSSKLQFKAMIRYVDDINIVFQRNNNCTNSEIFKELLKIEQGISNWLYKKLLLNINSKKTKRQIIKDSRNKNLLLKEITKRIYSFNTEYIKIKDPSNSLKMSDHFAKFINSLQKFKYSDEYEFKFEFKHEDIENLKLIFRNDFRKYILKRDNIKIIKKCLSTIDIELTTDYINIILLLFFATTELNNVTSAYLLNFLKDGMQYNDKRHIHLLLMTLSQNIRPNTFYKNIKRNKRILLNDDYGKYLLLFYLKENILDKIELNSNKIYLNIPKNIYHRILNETKPSRSRTSAFLYNSHANYYTRLIHNIYNDQQLQSYSITLQLKEFVNYFLTQRWHVAFNSFLNLFHEICKIKYKLGDANVKQLVKIITQKNNNVNLNDELLILRFFDRRNVNTVSHPSQKGKASLMVNKIELEQYCYDILKLLSKII
jgi:hypothetical protein